MTECYMVYTNLSLAKTLATTLFPNYMEIQEIEYNIHFLEFIRNHKESNDESVISKHYMFSFKKEDVRFFSLVHEKEIIFGKILN